MSLGSSSHEIFSTYDLMCSSWVFNFTQILLNIVAYLTKFILHFDKRIIGVNLSGFKCTLKKLNHNHPSLICIYHCDSHDLKLHSKLLSLC